ncbi:EpsG family protein [Flavobacterium sp.]|uniref:EpsG family protein n=1 Tax=Flavobacterium sp. TaxID=239 RepID=UPI00391C10B6
MQLIFFIFPFLGFYKGVKDFFSAKYRYGILFFAFWFGYSVFQYSGDVTRYASDFSFFAQYSWSDLWHLIVNFSDESLKFSFLKRTTYNSKPDIFAVTLGFLVSRFTENPRWFFAIVSVIYVYFILKFLDEVVRFTGKHNTKGWRIYFAALVFIVPFYVGVTGIRFWPALFLFGIMLLRYFNTKEKKYIFYTLSAVLIHYTFIVPCLIAMIAVTVKVNRRIFKLLIFMGIVYVLLSSTTSSLDFIKNALSFFQNDTISNATSGYVDEDSIIKKSTNLATKNWYVVWRSNLINAFFFSFFILDFFRLNKWKEIKQNKSFETVYCFFFILALFTFNLGSLGRFVYLFYFLVIIRILMYQAVNKNDEMIRLSYFFVPIMLLHIIVSFRAGFYYVDPFLLISPSPALLFVQSPVSLSEFLIGH